MKKSVIFIAIIALVALIGGTLTGCSSSVASEGTAWSKQERLEYSITEDGVGEIGKMTVELTRLDKDASVQIPEIREEAFTISENFGNAKIVTTAVDLNGNEILKSVCLIQGCESLASYKKVDNGDTKYLFRGYYSGKKLYYTNSADTAVDDFEKVKISSGYMDNQALYFALRCQDLDGGYSASYTMIDCMSGAKESIAVASSNSESYTLELPVHYIDKVGNAQTSEETCVAVSVAKSEEPKGSTIMLYYTPFDIANATGFELYNNNNDPESGFHFPVQIKENNITYSLSNICVNI